MSFVYEVTEIEGKGLGCVATKDIRKGSLILNENPQIYENTEEKSWSSKWIKSLLKSFNKMSEADQMAYMRLKNICSEEIIERRLDLKSKIGKIEKDSGKAGEIFQICCIY